MSRYVPLPGLTHGFCRREIDGPLPGRTRHLQLRRGSRLSDGGREQRGPVPALPDQHRAVERDWRRRGRAYPQSRWVARHGAHTRQRSIHGAGHGDRLVDDQLGSKSNAASGQSMGPCAERVSARGFRNPTQSVERTGDCGTWFQEPGRGSESRIKARFGPGRRVRGKRGGPGGGHCPVLPGNPGSWY
jgi:hypothetical protein